MTKIKNFIVKIGNWFVPALVNYPYRSAALVVVSFGIGYWVG